MCHAAQCLHGIKSHCKYILCNKGEPGTVVSHNLFTDPPLGPDFSTPSLASWRGEEIGLARARSCLVGGGLARRESENADPVNHMPSPALLHFTCALCSPSQDHFPPRYPEDSIPRLCLHTLPTGSGGHGCLWLPGQSSPRPGCQGGTWYLQAGAMGMSSTRRTW